MIRSQNQVPYFELTCKQDNLLIETDLVFVRKLLFLHVLRYTHIKSPSKGQSLERGRQDAIDKVLIMEFRKLLLCDLLRAGNLLSPTQISLRL